MAIVKCGCGKKTTIPIKNNASCNRVKGCPMDFITGHNTRDRSGTDNPMYGIIGKNHPSWKGGINITGRKYVRVYTPGHPRSHNNYVFEHILVAEKRIGDYLPREAEVHHIDFDGLNNNEDNLMIFDSKSEHMKFHASLRKRGDNGRWI